MAFAAESCKNAEVNAHKTGDGVLRMNGGAVARGQITAETRPVVERDVHMVRVLMRESFLGGCELDVKLSPEDAAHFASAIYALAKQAMIENERLAEAGTSLAA